MELLGLAIPSDQKRQCEDPFPDHDEMRKLHAVLRRRALMLESLGFMLVRWGLQSGWLQGEV